MRKRKSRQEITPDNWEMEVAIALKASCQAMATVIERKDRKDAQLITAIAAATKHLGELLITQKALGFDPPEIKVAIRTDSGISSE